MQQISTTPFGRRPVTAGLLAAQARAQTPCPAPRTDKYAALDDLCVARAAFGVSDRDLAVLAALVSFHPGRELAEDVPLIVFPSNAALSARAHGMAESTLRRHLAALVGAGLVLRHDSPNGKRYAARDRSGQLVRAFGFDLRPLLARSAEIARAARAAREVEGARKRRREEVVLMLRDAVKLAEYGREAVPGANWIPIEARMREAQKALRRKLTADDLMVLGGEVSEMLAEVQAMLATSDTEKMDGNAAKSERHLSNSNSDLSDSEPYREKARAAAVCQPETGPPEETGAGKGTAKSPPIPLALVLKACPDILPYGGDDIAHWHELVGVADRLRGMMGVSAAAWVEARQVMGDATAATVLAAMLQRVDAIRNPGGYLRALTRKAEEGAFSPGPMVMALLNSPDR